MTKTILKHKLRFLKSVTTTYLHVCKEMFVHLHCINQDDKVVEVLCSESLLFTPEVTDIHTYSFSIGVDPHASRLTPLLV